MTKKITPANNSANQQNPNAKTGGVNPQRKAAMDNHSRQVAGGKKK